MQPKDDDPDIPAGDTFMAELQESMNLLFNTPSKDKILYQRNHNYAGSLLAAVAILLLLARETKLSSHLEYALIFLAAGLPFPLLLGIVDEYFLFIGRKSYRHYQTVRQSPIAFVIYAVGWLAISVGFTLIIFHFSIVAGWLFLGACALGVAGSGALFSQLKYLCEADKLAEMTALY
jgi:hypothetical protein